MDLEVDTGKSKKALIVHVSSEQKDAFNKKCSGAGVSQAAALYGLICAIIDGTINLKKKRG